MAALNTGTKPTSPNAMSFNDGLVSASQVGQTAMAQVPEQISRQMQAATETARGMSSEMLRYAGERLTAHAEHLQCLAGCETPQAVLNEQMRFAQTSVQQFSQGISKLFLAAQPQEQKSARFAARQQS